MIKKTLRAVVLSAVMALLAVSFLAGSASAQSAASNHGVTTRIVSSAPLSGTPNINIVKKHGKYHFSPIKITCNHVNNPCNTWTNKTNVSVKIYVNGPGNYFFTLAPHGTASESYSGPSTWTFYITDLNPKALETVTVT